MRIPIDELEVYAGSTIYSRGLNYCKKNAVHEPEESHGGEFTTIVEGTDSYNVSVTINDGLITDFDCDCPYDGPICKHVVATVLYLNMEELGINTSKKKAKSTKSDAKKPKVKEDKFTEILESLSQEELVNFIKVMAELDKSFKERFINYFNNDSKGNTLAFYQKKISSIINSASNRYGFIDWHTAKSMAYEIDDVIDEASVFIENSNYRSGFYILSTIIVEVHETIQHSDDSHGEIGGLIMSSFELLSEIIHLNDDAELQDEIFGFFVNSFTKQIFKGWDWHYDAIHHAADMATTEKQVQTIIDICNKSEGESYEAEQLKRIKYYLLETHYSADEAGKFMYDNLNILEFRTKAIEAAIEKEDYEKAIDLANEGITADKTRRPGYVSKWLALLFKIAKLQNDKDNIVKIAQEMMLFHNEDYQYYYNEFKSCFTEAEWQKELHDFIVKVYKNNRYYSSHLLEMIFVEEKMWDKLFEHVMQSNSIYQVIRFEKYLKKDYKKELAEFYEKSIRKDLEFPSKRSRYQEVVSHIRRISVLSGMDKAQDFITELKTTYKKRPALIEELDLIFE